MLDQYEQEQAAFQEGSVVRGTVVGVNDRSVVIDFGFKSEGAVPIEEFMEGGEVTVKRGDEVEVLIKSMESQEGVPVLSRADAVRMRAWDDLEKATATARPSRARSSSASRADSALTLTAWPRSFPARRLTYAPYATSNLCATRRSRRRSSSSTASARTSSCRARRFSNRRTRARRVRR